MFQPKALHLALAASAALVISAGARSDTGLNQGDSGATLPTRDKAPTPAPDPAPCEGDLNGDRRIDVLDLIKVILGWGTNFPVFPIVSVVSLCFAVLLFIPYFDLRVEHMIRLYYEASKLAASTNTPE